MSLAVERHLVGMVGRTRTRLDRFDLMHVRALRFRVSPMHLETAQGSGLGQV
jgi:hypothetical protein